VTIEMLRQVIHVQMLKGFGTRDSERGTRDGDREIDVSTEGSPSAGPVRLPSPGMLEKHYSPRATLTLYEGEAHSALESLLRAARAALAEQKSVGVIAAEEDRPAFEPLESRDTLFLRLIGSRDEPAAVASRLYTTMRELDAAGADVILVHGFPDHGLWAAVQDRLRRAAAGRIVRK